MQQWVVSWLLVAYLVLTPVISRTSGIEVGLSSAIHGSGKTEAFFPEIGRYPIEISNTSESPQNSFLFADLRAKGKIAQIGNKSVSFGCRKEIEFFSGADPFRLVVWYSDVNRNGRETFSGSKFDRETVSVHNSGRSFAVILSIDSEGSTHICDIKSNSGPLGIYEGQSAQQQSP